MRLPGGVVARSAALRGGGGAGNVTGGREDMLTPTRVPKWRLGRARVKMAACGGNHTLVMAEAGSTPRRA